MKITKEQIADLKPCKEGYEWYLKNGSADLLETLLKVNEHNDSWARWLFTHLMNLSQKREIAIFAAELVLPIFEKKHPKDDRPRKAIEAAKKVLKDPSDKNKRVSAAYATYAAYAAYAAASYSASYASYSASYAASDASDAYAAYASYAASYAASDAYAAAYASAASAYAADSAAAAAYAVSVFAASDRKEIQEKIIREAVKILSKSERAKERKRGM